MRKVLNFVKGKKDEKKDPHFSLNTANISVEITDPAGITTPSDDYDFIGTSQQCNDYEVDLTGKDKSISKLHKAAWVGNLDKVKSHLKKIDVNVVDASNRTPLHLAAAQGHTNVVWFLLSNKAQIDIYDVGKKTAFMKAVEGGYKEIVSNMLEKGADINAQDAEGNTPLHIATKMGYYEIASVLLKKGADFESTNEKYELPLHIATTAEHMDLVELLLRYGAGVNVTDSNARTPLMLAARCGNAPLVELFLEYGARRDMTDNNNLTARDFAINKGYEDLAALLITATSEKIDEEEKVEDDASGTISPQVTSKQQSGSSGSLIPANRSNQDLSDDIDSWNHSNSCCSNVKAEIPKSKLQQFLSPSSDEKINEDQGLMKEEKNVHDSPHSCVIPPPLKPPRSWDLIQAGMIDDNTGSEVKRCSLTALGTLRSRRESFNDSIKSDIESPVSPKDTTDVRGLERGNSSKQTLSDKEMQRSQRKDKSELSTVESDWDSDESLPLDKSIVEETHKSEIQPPKPSHCVSVDVHQEPIDIDDLPAPPSPSQLNAPEATGLLQVLPQSAPESGAVSPEPVSEKRARMLLMQNQQSVELTLTDDHTDEKSDHSEGSPSALPKDIEEDGNIQNPPSSAGTLGRDGTMLGYEEMWESNAAYIPTSPLSTNPESALSSNHSLPRIEEKVETSDGEQSPSSHIIIDLNLSKVIAIPDEVDLIRSPVGRSIGSIPLPVPLAVVCKSEEVEDLTKKLQESKNSGTKRHVRNKSMSLALPPNNLDKERDLISSTDSCLPATMQDLQDQCINRQLECYDEAIRDLAASASSKDVSPCMTINPLTNKALQSDDIHAIDLFVQESSKIMPDLLSGSKVASLSAMFDSADKPVQSIRNICGSVEMIRCQDPSGGEQREGLGNEDEIVESLNKEPSCSEKQSALEKPIRKKRKSLFALQKLEPTSSQGSDIVNTELSSSDSDEEPAFWSSFGISKVHRQPTVIMKSDNVQSVVPSSFIPPVSVSLSDEVQIDILSAGSSSEDATAPLEDQISSSNVCADSQLDENPPCVAENVDKIQFQPDAKSINEYSKSEESLLKHHLQAVTEEHGRLAEATIELGERTERLLYELADARQAARARDEVISLLQLQLQRLEESHCKGLEEAQTNRFHLDSRDQEVRHLEDVCSKAEEDKRNLKEIIRLKDKEIMNLSLMQTSKQEEIQRQLFTREREKDMVISELRIHLKYLEEEKNKLKEALAAAEQHQVSLQARNEALLEEKARTMAQNATDLHCAQEEASKWRNLYESSVMKLEAMDQTQLKVLLDAKNHEGEAAESFLKEICCAFDRLEKEKEEDRKIWQAKIKEEVSNAVQLLKSEYEKLEEALRNHNQTLEALVEKLQMDLKVASERQESIEIQLKLSQEELQHARNDVSQMHALQLELSQRKHQSLADSNKIKVLLSECETKDQALSDIRKTLEIMRQEKVMLSELYSLQKAKHLEVSSQPFNDNLNGKKQEVPAQSSQRVEGAISSELCNDLSTKSDSLKNENDQLKHHIDELNKEIHHLRNEIRISSEELALEKQRIRNMCDELHDVQRELPSKVTSQLENTLRQEKEDLERQIAELKSKLQKRDSSPSSATLSNASAMTDQVRWNQSGLMGVVQKQKEEIENLKAECCNLKAQIKSFKSPLKFPPEVKQRSPNPSDRKPIQNYPNKPQNAVDHSEIVKKGGARPSNSDGTVTFVSICEKCGERSDASHFSKKNCVETQTIEGCESPAHASKCSSPRHNWSKRSGTNIEQELQAQAERCLRHQQKIAGLKSELQLLRGGSGDYQINLQKQVSDLQQKIKDEVSLRRTLEVQINKMKYDVQEKVQIEKELEKLKGRLEKEFVSRQELDHLMKLRTKLGTEYTLHSELSTKLAQVDKLLLQQVHDRSTCQVKDTSEALIRKEHEETRQYLVSELAKVQASLQAKEEEEKELKIKCEKLSRECDKKNEQRRKMLIEKSHSLGQQPMKESRSTITEPKLPLPHPVSVVKEPLNPPSSENPYSKLLRKELKKSAEKFKSPDPLLETTAAEKSEEYLKKKYCLP